MRGMLLLGAVGMVAAGAADGQKGKHQPVTLKSAPHATPTALPVFSFMGDDTEVPTKRTMLNAADWNAERKNRSVERSSVLIAREGRSFLASARKRLRSEYDV